MDGKIEITVKDGKFSMKSENVNTGQALDIMKNVIVHNINSIDEELRENISLDYIGELMDELIPEYLLVKH